MASIGRNAPCPCGSGRKVKKCHPDGGPSASFAPAARGSPFDLAVLPAAGRPRSDDAAGDGAADPAGGEFDDGSDDDRRGPARPAPPPGPEGLRIARQILDARLGPGDLAAIRAALVAQIRSRRARDLARAQAVIRTGMRVTYLSQHGPREGVVDAIRRTRAVVIGDDGPWLVPLTALQPAFDAESGPAAASV